VSNATRVDRITDGDKNERTTRIRLVKDNKGARYWLINFESPWIMVYVV